MACCSRQAASALGSRELAGVQALQPAHALPGGRWIRAIGGGVREPGVLGFQPLDAAALGKILFEAHIDVAQIAHIVGGILAHGISQRPA